MTPIQTHPREALAADRGARPWRTETIETLRLAWPMALTQLGQIAMMTTDLAMLGRLGDRVVAAASLAHTILFAAFVLGMGLVSAVAPLAAQAFGAGDARGVRNALRVGLWATALVGAPLTLAMFAGEPALLALGQDPEAAALAARYLHGLAFSLVPAWVFIALRGFMGAVNRPEPALWIMLAAVPVNAALAYGLIYGAFGLPRLDLLGAGLATTIVNLGMCAIGFHIALTRAPFRKYRIFGEFMVWDWPLMRRLLV
ncbi:MAG TPA: MATE family efflux transporter, partial [Beijerinckiaceae bacterium]